MFLKLHLDLMADLCYTILFFFFFLKTHDSSPILLRLSHEGQRLFQELQRGECFYLNSGL